MGPDQGGSGMLFPGAIIRADCLPATLEEGEAVYRWEHSNVYLGLGRPFEWIEAFSRVITEPRK